MRRRWRRWRWGRRSRLRFVPVIFPGTTITAGGLKPSSQHIGHGVFVSSRDLF